MKPEKFSSDGRKDVRIKHLNDFEKLCALIEDNTSIRAKSLSLYEFISRIEYVKEKRERESKSGIRF